ncbi:hypothetical protein OKW76_03175 [Sphingomonas sp. S1-29]|uniref:hypothetical protein n=1 Tax=Sphingomonas sp. S1-29 TaxID=2991074 RepID=UPI00223EF6B5|nr:hypothetical protein [Sphingomonas sp. S1-29]UZK70070.1 hypothetical protein OKW76_03175 [Sphingomonas sp. S1-29]
MSNKFSTIDERLANAELFDHDNLSKIFAYAWRFMESYDRPISPAFVMYHIKEAIFEEIVTATDLDLP